MENYIFGIHPVLEAIEKGDLPEKILIQRGLQGENFVQLFNTIRQRNIPYQMVPIEKLNSLTRKNHQGIIAFLPVIPYYELSEVMPNIYEKGEVPLLVVADGVTDVRNLGAIARSAECFGAHALIISQKGTAPINADSIKTSSGALARLQVCREENLIESLAFLKECGVKIVAATEKSGVRLNQADLNGPIAIIVGSEEKGIHRSLLSLADITVSIPMAGKVASLNVSVASGVFLYEVVRQRMQSNVEDLG